MRQRRRTGSSDGSRGYRLLVGRGHRLRGETGAYPRNRIGTALLAVKSVNAGTFRHTSDHVGRPGRGLEWPLQAVKVSLRKCPTTEAEPQRVAAIIYRE